MCAPYVVGNLKENFKSDTPNEKSPTVGDMHNVQSVCVLQRIRVTQSWAGFKKFTVTVCQSVS